MKTIILISLIFLCNSAFSIVNIESMMKKGANKPFNASTQLSYTEIDSKSTFSSFGASLNLRYMTKLNTENNKLLFQDRFFATFSSKKSKKDTEDIQDNQFFHLRYTRMFNSWFGLEALGQRDEDLFNSLERRQLYGLTSRFDFKINKTKLIAGVGSIREKEIVNLKQREITNTTRLSSHLNIVTPLKEDLVDFSFIVYFQPAINEFSDYRMFFTSLLDVHLYKNLKFSFSHQMVQDSLPPTGVPKVTAQTKQMITYSF
jgi:hypothetical protein